MKLGDMGVNSRKSKNVDLSQKQIEKRFISEKDILSSFFLVVFWFLFSIGCVKKMLATIWP